MPRSTLKDEQVGAPVRRPTSRHRHRRRPTIRSGPLVSTPGPDPSADPAKVKLAIGTIVGSHGVQGELKVRLATDDPEHLATLKWIYLGDEERPRRLLGFRTHAGFALMKLKGITTPEQAASLRGESLRISGRDAKPLQPGEYFLYQVIGLKAVTEDGQEIGTVSDLIETGANDVFVITPTEPGPTQLIPSLPDVVLDIDPANGTMTVRPLEYLDD